MSDPISITLGSRSNPGRYGYEGAARLINCYVEELGEEGKVPLPIYASHGWEAFSSPSGGGIRALLAVENTLYTVAGRVLNSIDTSGSATVLGGVASDGLVTMARNRRATPQIAITCDGLSQIVVNGALSIISDADLPAANSVTQQNGYFVFSIPDGRMFSSQIDDGTTIDGLDFATAESNPDGLVRVFTSGRDLLAFGPRSMEAWTDQGGETFPFSRVTTRDFGCLAAGSIATVMIKRNGTISDATGFVGTNSDGAYAGVMLMQGYQANKISTPACDRDVMAESRPQDITGLSWDDGTHSFYAISGANFTWVFDATTGLPHERASYGLNRWRASCSASFNQSTIFGDYATANLYRSKPSLTSEAGSPIAMTVQTPPVHGYPYPMTFHNVFLDVVPGVGLNSNGDELDPRVGISYSEDGGATWSAERLVAVGRQGQRRTRVKSSRWGMSGEDGRTWRFRMSADVAKAMMGCSMAVSKRAA